MVKIFQNFKWYFRFVAFLRVTSSSSAEAAGEAAAVAAAASAAAVRAAASYLVFCDNFVCYEYYILSKTLVVTRA